MSKKKPTTAKKATKKPAKKPAKKPIKKKAGKASRRPSADRLVVAPASAGRTSQATIFIYAIDGKVRVRTSPHLMTAGPGHIEWTVVNLTSTENVPVQITWPKGGPWGDQPIEIREGWIRLSAEGGRSGRYKYNVTAAGFTEDPELDMPEN